MGKYDGALQYILALEEQLRRSGSSSSSSFFPTDLLQQDLEDVRNSYPQSPGANELAEEGNITQGRTPWQVGVHNDHEKDTSCRPFSRHHSNHPSTLTSQMHIIDNTIIRPIAAKISPGANEKPMSAKDDSNECLEKESATLSHNDMVVSDDDSATVDKTLPNSSPSNDNSSYSVSDDETIIESDQALFLDASPQVVDQHLDSNTCKSDALLGSDVGVEGEDVAVMAEFLDFTFQPTDAVEDSSPEQRQSLAASTFVDELDASDMDALLSAENDAMLLLPDICLET